MIKNLINIFGQSKPYAIKNQSTVYNFNKSNNVSIGPVWKKTATSLLIAYFNLNNSLISKPVFTFSPQGVKIHILYYKPLGTVEYRREMWTEITRPENQWKINIKFGKKIPKFSVPSEVLKPTTFFLKTKGSTWENKPVLPKNQKYVNTVGQKQEWDVGIPTKDLISNLNSWKGRLLFLPGKRLNEIAVLLSKLLQTNVQLEVVPLKYPYHDSNILAQYLVINSETNSYGRLKKQLFKKAVIFTGPAGKAKKPSISDTNSNISNKEIEIKTLSEKKKIVSRLTGIKIRIGGRLAKQRVVPKRTVKTTYKGRVSNSKTNIVDSSIITSKNKKGAFSIRVWTSHKI